MAPSCLWCKHLIKKQTIKPLIEEVLHIVKGLRVGFDGEMIYVFEDALEKIYELREKYSEVEE